MVKYINYTQGQEEFEIIKIPILFRLIYKFKVISTKTPKELLEEFGKLILKYIQNNKEPKTTETLLQKSEGRFPYQTYQDLIIKLEQLSP